MIDMGAVRAHRVGGEFIGTLSARFSACLRHVFGGFVGMFAARLVTGFSGLHSLCRSETCSNSPADNVYGPGQTCSHGCTVTRMDEPVDTEVIWKEPPETRGAGGIWAARLGILLPKPGRWAIVHHYTSPRGAEFSAGNLRRQARSNKLPPGLWEFTSRINHDSGGSDLYARWMGIPGDDSAQVAEQVEREYQESLRQKARSGVSGE